MDSRPKLGGADKGYIKNDDLKDLIRKKNQRNKPRRKSTSDDSDYDRDHGDSDEDYRGPSAENERIENPAIKKLKLDKMRSSNKPQLLPLGSKMPKLGQLETEAPDRPINSQDWKLINNIC